MRHAKGRNMGVMNHVSRRGAVYVWRRRVPTALSPGKPAYIQISLKTRELSTGKLLGAIVTAESDQIFQCMAHEKLTPSDLRDYLARVVEIETARIKEQRAVEPVPETGQDWVDSVHRDRAQVQALRMLAARRGAPDFLLQDYANLEAQGLPFRAQQHAQRVAYVCSDSFRDSPTVPPPYDHALEPISDKKIDEDDRLQLHRLTWLGMARAMEALDREKTGIDDLQEILEVNEEPAGAEAQSPAPPTSPPAPAPTPAPKTKPPSRYAPLISEVTERLCRQKLAASSENKLKSTRKTVNQIRATMRLFEQAAGKSRIDEITQADITYFVDCLAEIPKQYNKSASDRSLTIHQLIERGQDLPACEIGLAPATVNRNLGFVGQVLKRARSEGHHPAEPLDLTSLRQRNTASARQQRPAFTDEDIAKLFSHATWQAPPVQTGRQAPIWWVPLIAALSGMRREEICGMTLAEINLDHAIPHFDLVPTANRALKNDQAIRKVPIHPNLLGLGFAAYVRTLRKRGETDLFPGLRPTNRSETFGDNFHNDWARIRTETLGSQAGGKVFHSFRHYVVTTLKRTRPAMAHGIADLVGHLLGNMTDDRYRSTSELKLLQEVVEGLPSLVPEHLGWADPDGT